MLSKGIGPSYTLVKSQLQSQHLLQQHVGFLPPMTQLSVSTSEVGGGMCRLALSCCNTIETNRFSHYLPNLTTYRSIAQKHVTLILVGRGGVSPPQSYDTCVQQASFLDWYEYSLLIQLAQPPQKW